MGVSTSPVDPRRAASLPTLLLVQYTSLPGDPGVHSVDTVLSREALTRQLRGETPDRHLMQQCR